MSNETEDDQSKGTHTGTRVDFGDDLLATRTGIRKAESETPFDEIGDKLESAKILLGEGLLEEAKKILRKLLIDDPHNVIARKRLEDIHEKELQQIFGDSTPRPTLKSLKEGKEVTRLFSSESLIHDL